MKLDDKKVLVFGAGKSGISSARLLHKQNAKLVLYDSNEKLNSEDIIGKLGFDDITLIFGEITDNCLNDIDLIVLSPGIAIDHPVILKAQEKNIPVWGEIELAYRYAKGKIIGITGTNGKTTTTSLVGELMKLYFDEVYVVGNIGNPYTDIAMETSENSVSVIELSSFQLETIHEFKPDVSAILNITPDHLNRHHTMENYIRMKENVTKNQTKKELCVLNYEDKTLREMAGRLNTRVMFFSSEREMVDGIYLDGDDIFYQSEGKKEHICNVNDLKILGKHNYENVMAAAGIAITMGIPIDIIKKGVLAFQAVEHRIEYVETINGVAYYNDSKGTNPDAAIKAVQAMKRPTILIGGGYDKNSDYDEWIESFQDKIKYLILLGQTREKIAACAVRHGFKNIIMVDSLKEAVKVSSEKAEEGDAVLLSPACASWGMFENYEQRGRLFKEYVRELLNEW